MSPSYAERNRSLSGASISFVPARAVSRQLRVASEMGAPFLIVGRGTSTASLLEVDRTRTMKDSTVLSSGRFDRHRARLACRPDLTAVSTTFSVTWAP